jgi:hypothetical protein
MTQAVSKKVSAKAAERLQQAQAAIRAVKDKTAGGAGNQLESIASSGGNSSVRAQKAKSLVPGAIGNRSASVARAGEIAGGGTCRELASMVYHELLAKGVAPIRIVKSAGVDHTFVLIGDLDGDKPGDLVAADAWPTLTQACLLTDHFAFKSIDKIQGGSVTESDDKPVHMPFSVEDLAAQLVKSGLSPAQCNFAPSAMKGASSIRYLFEEQPVVKLIPDRPSRSHGAQGEAERIAAITDRQDKPSAPAPTPASQHPTGVAGPSAPLASAPPSAPAVDVSKPLAEIEFAYSHDFDDDKAAKALAALAKQAPSERETIRTRAGQLDSAVLQILDKLLDT